MTRTRLNMGTGELDAIARIAGAQREVKDIADRLYFGKTSKKDERQDFARRLNAVAASLKSAELTLGEE